MITTYTLNHFGIVAGICKELRLRETIDTLIPPDPQQKVTTGEAVVAMIINGLGFSNRTLYLFPQFFENKPVDLLISKGLNAADLNDDTVGRALDRLFDNDCTRLFCHVASVVTRIAAVDRKFGHLDTTTFSVYGDYESSEEEGAAIHVTRGHSKQKRPDLKQIFLNLLVSSDGGIPLFMQALDGNSSDVTTFRKTVTEFRRGLRENLKEITYWVADSSFYSETTLKEVRNDLSWISRVPGRINEVKKLVETTALQLLEAEPVPLVPLQEEGYTYRKHRSMYGGVEQRWFVIHSVQAETRAIHAVKRAVEKERDQIRRLMKRLQKKEYGSGEEARYSLQILREKAKFHDFEIVQVKKEVKYKQRGRPARNTTDDKNRTVYYRAVHAVTVNPGAVDFEVKKRSLFIVATNELSSEKLSDQEVFENYKGQKHVERGFRFLKDPLFFASSLFLKKPERIVSLTMVMCLSLLVYSIGERKLRQLLKEQGKNIRNQVKKATQRPTMRWIFQLFEDVHLVKIEDSLESRYEVKNLRPDGIKTLKILGENYMEPYLLI